MARRIRPSWRLPGTSADGCWSGIATFAWKPSAKRWKPLPQVPKRRVMTQTMTQTRRLRALAQSKLLKDLVDLVGIEPTTSSMPWKRAPSCATGPLRGRNDVRIDGVSYFLAAAWLSQTSVSVGHQMLRARFAMQSSDRVAKALRIHSHHSLIGPIDVRNGDQH